jgi:hypothetical protein
MGILHLAAVSAQASVELTSPTTRRQWAASVPGRLETPHYLGCLDGMAGRAHRQLKCGRLQLQRVEELAIHLDVVVLSAMDQMVSTCVSGGRTRAAGAPF